MPNFPLDFRPKAVNALSAINKLPVLGATDSIWSGNATTAGVIAAIQSLPVTAGTSPDLINKVAVGIQYGVDAGVIGATHGFSTIAGAANAVQAYIPEYPASFAEFLPE